MIMLRQGAHHAFGVLHNVFNFVLAALCVLIAYVLLRDDLPVPDFVRGRIEREFAARGFTVSFTRAEVDPTAKILVQGLTLAPVRFGGPVISAGRVLLELDRLNVLAGQIDLVSLEAEDLQVICPASISPTGEPEPIVTIAAIRLTHHAGVWRLPGGGGTIGPLHLTARGAYQIPRPAAAAPPVDLNVWLDKFATLAPRVVRELARLDVLDQPRLHLYGTGGGGRPFNLEVAFTAEGWRDARIGEAYAVQARTHVTLGGDQPAPLRLSARVENFWRSDGLSVDAIELVADWLAFPTAQNYLPWQVHATARQVVHPKLTVPTPVLAVFPLAYPLVDIDASAVLEGEPLALTAEADVRTRAGVVELHGSAGRHWLARVSTILGRDVTYYAAIDTPPDFSARAEIASGLEWQRVDFRLTTPALVARKVALDRARVRGAVTRDGLQIDLLEASSGEEAVRGTYSSDFKGRDYRFRLTGAMRPLEIAPWFGGWWQRFWQDYTFAGGAPQFDIDQHGNWLRPEPILLSGSGAADRISYRGVAFDRAITRLFMRPGYLDLFEATLLRPEGRIDGEVQLQFERGTPNPISQAFRFSSNADLVEVAKVFGKGGEDMLAPYRYKIPPATTMVGKVAREGDTYDVQLDIGVNTAEEFRYLDFPLEWLTTRALVHNKQVGLPEIYAGYANGVLNGSADVDNGRLKFTAKLTNADFDRAIKTYTEYTDRNFPTPPEKIEPGSVTRENYGGVLTFGLSAAGPITNLKAFEGEGEVALNGAELYQLKVIGLFSNILGTGLGVLGFTDAVGPFQVRRDKIHFPDLRVTGKSALLEATGDYSLRDGSIDFRVRMKPLDQSAGFITKLFGRIVDPLTKLLFEARLTGTLRNPKNSVAILAPRAPEPEPEPAPPPPPP